MRLVVRLSIALLLAATAAAALAGDIDTEKLKASLSMTSESGDGTSGHSYAWAGDGKWNLGSGYRKFSLEMNSRYSKSDDSRYDRLKTWWRYTWQDVPETQWHPVFLISTEGDHSLDQVHTLGAFGFRKKHDHGIIEVTAGASKDIRTSEAWVGDLGLLVSYHKSWNRLSWGLNPQGDYGLLGDVRYRDDRFRYNVDTDLNYALGNHMSATYRLTFGNTTPDSRKTQFFGISYDQNK